MYVSRDDLDGDTFFQGDIIDNFPFFFTEDNFSIYENSETTKVNNLQLNALPQEASVIIPYKLSRIIILSQTCDAQRRKTIIIAPVHKMQDYQEAGILNRSKIESIKERRKVFWFYLPAMQDTLEESIIDFQLIAYVPRIFIDKFKERKVLSMSDWGRHHLGWALSGYFGRPILDKDII